MPSPSARKGSPGKAPRGRPLERKAMNIAVVGFGNIGSAVVELLLSGKYDEWLKLRKIVVKHLDKQRPMKVPDGLMTDRVEEVLSDPSIDIVVELTGLSEEARDIILRALRSGKHVVTANKTVIAHYGREIFQEAIGRDRQVGIGGTLVGLVFLLSGLSEKLYEGRIRNLVGILNGTANFILSSMANRGLDLREASALARQMGYAEPDPKEDVEGIDAANKLKILLGLVNGSMNLPKNIHVEGISGVETQDVEYAKEFGYVFKQVGVILRGDRDGTFAGILTALVPADSFLGSIEGANNAMIIEDDLGVKRGFIAPGAGKSPTAQAILEDLIGIVKGVRSPIPQKAEEIRVEDMSKLVSRFYLRFTVVDRPGVLAELTGILAKRGISIAAINQKEHGKEPVSVAVISHRAKRGDVLSAVEEIDKLPIVKGRTKVFHILDLNLTSQEPLLKTA